MKNLMLKKMALATSMIALASFCLTGCGSKKTTERRYGAPQIKEEEEDEEEFNLDEERYNFVVANTYYGICRIDYLPKALYPDYEETHPNERASIIDFSTLADPNAENHGEYIEPFEGYTEYSFYVRDQQDPKTCYPLAFTLHTSDDIYQFEDELGIKYDAELDISHIDTVNLVPMDIPEPEPDPEPAEEADAEDGAEVKDGEVKDEEAKSEEVKDEEKPEEAPAEEESEEAGEEESIPENLRPYYYIIEFVLYTNDAKNKIENYSDDQWTAFLKSQKATVETDK